MIYFFAIIALTHSFMLHGAESLPLLAHSNLANNVHALNNPQTTIIIHYASNITEHTNGIRKFLKKQSGKEFEDEREFFKKHDVLLWHGFTNQILLAHAQEKLNQLRTLSTATRIQADIPATNAPATATSPTSLYAQMLEDLIEYSETNDKEQKKILCKKAAISGIGAAVLAAIQYFTNYIPHVS